MHMKVRAKPVYAGKVPVRRLIELARKHGLDVGGIELAPDGTIRLFEKATARAISRDRDAGGDGLAIAGKGSAWS